MSTHAKVGVPASTRARGDIRRCKAIDATLIISIVLRRSCITHACSHLQQMSLLHKAMMLLTIARARGFAARAAVRAPTTRLMSAAAWEALGLSSDMSNLVSKQWPGSGAPSAAALPPFKAGRRRRRRRRDRERQDLGLSIAGGAARRSQIRRKHTLYPAALVLAKNRELGTQLRRVAARLGADTQPPVFGRKQALLARGAPRRRARALAYAPGKAPDVLVATPSFAAAFDRDLDLWEGLSTLVLDEADMLLDGGFKKQLDRCLVALKRVERRGKATMIWWKTFRKDAAASSSPRRCRTRSEEAVDGLVTKYFANATRCADLPMHGVVSTLDACVRNVQSDDDETRSLGELLEHGTDDGVLCKTANRASTVAERLALIGVAAAPYTKDVDPESDAWPRWICLPRQD